LGLVVREGALLAGIGVVLGLAASLAATRVLRSMLFEVTPSDPWTYSVMIVVVAGAGLLASLVPARRAASVDPIITLR
jgi:putative ABC transport system permease protein